MRKLILSLLLLSACLRTSGSRVPTERTLWPVCYDHEGYLDLPSDDPPHKPACKNWVQLRWPNLPQKPLTVGLSTDPEAAGAPAEADVRAAIAVWNNALGFVAFRLVDSQEADVMVYATKEMLCRITASGVSCILGIAIHRQTHGVLSVKVGLFGAPGLETTIHEFGHVLGLAHDGADSAYVMRRYHRASTDIRISPADIKAIKRLYGVR